MSTPSPQKSTIVRVFKRPTLVGVRAGIRLLDRAWPALAARCALRLWLTPRRRRRRAAPLPGERFTVALAAAPRWATRPPHRQPPGSRFAVRQGITAECWGQGPVVYLLHGWGGARTDLGTFVAPLVAAGAQVVALDAAAHGESAAGPLGRRRTTLPEFAASLAAVAAVTGPAHAIISHSAGCQAAALAVRDGLSAERLVFLAPVATFEPLLDAFHRLLGNGQRTQDRFRALLEAAAGRPMTDFDLPARAAEAEKLPELLVVHDDTDRETPLAGGQALAAAWPGARLVTTSGLGHRRLLADPDVVAQVVTYVTGHDAGPVGA